MGEALEARPALGMESRESFVGGCTDRDVVGVQEDAVVAERDGLANGSKRFSRGRESVSNVPHAR